MLCEVGENIMKYTKEPLDWMTLCNLVNDGLSDTNKVELTRNIAYSWELNEIDEIEVKILLKKLYSIEDRKKYEKDDVSC